MTYDPTTWNHEDVITSQKLNKIEKGLTDVAESAIFGFGGAQQSSDGLTPFSYINAGDPMPSNPKKGDTVFIKDGNDFTIYSYDGEQWNIKVDPNLSQRISDTLKKAKDSTDKAIADNNDQINNTVNEVAKEKIDLAIKDADFNNKAQAMADKALSDAKANTATVAKSTLDTANQNIADAKKSVTDDIAQEASDRASAVSALDTKAQGYADDAKKSATDGIAQEAKDRATAVSTVDKSAKGYADQAKQDAVDVATNADGVINKKIDDTASSLTSTISQNKVDANGKISTAQSTATQALNGLSTKVEKTDYDKKIGDLTTQLNTTTTTATQSKQDIVDIKSTNSSQDSKINSIVSDATKTQQTISDIQKSQSTQSDKLNQITTDVNGTKQSITDIQTQDGKQDTRMGTIETSVSGVKSDFSTYKTDANGRISTAQSTAQTAVDGLSSKVDTATYNAKTGQLTTDVTNVTQTANQAKTDIASIKQTDTKQDARMTTIEADADGTKTTVSNLQKAQNTQSGSISTLQQRADGFDATVTKVDNISVGGRNLLLGTEQFTGDWSRWQYVNTWDANPYNGHKAVSTNHAWGGPKYVINDLFNRKVVEHDTDYTLSVKIKNTSNASIDIYFFAPAIGISNRHIIKLPPNSDWTTISTTIQFSDINPNIEHGAMRFEPDSDITPYQGAIIQTEMKFERGNLTTDWTPAPEDVDSTIAKVKLTADEASTAVSKLTSADGIITKAQADIKANANAITEKVSKTDYNQKTGELLHNVNEAKDTADKAVRTIGDYKTSNDKRIKEAESSIERTANSITEKVSQTDYNKKTGELSGDISTLQQSAKGFEATAIKVDNLSVGGRNLLIGTNSNAKSWLNGGNGSYTTQNVAFNNGYKYNFTYTEASTWWSVYMFNGLQKDKFKPNTDYVLSFMANVSTDIKPGVRFANGASQHNFVNQVTSPTILSSNGDQRVVIQLRTDSSIPDESDQSLYIDGFVYKVGTFSIWDLKLESGNIATDWTPAPEDIESALAQVKVTADGVSSIVSDPKKGLSVRVQTAEGTLNTVKGIDIPALQNATFWQPYSSLNFNDYTKQGSFFFNTVTSKINGPTSSTAWIYLVVEQGTADNSRIKQTAWYDGVDGIKVTYVRTLNSGIWSSWYANDNDSVTTISKTNSSVKQEISDRKNGDSNTLQSSKDFTQSSITSYDKGIQSQLTQTSDAILAKVGATNLFPNSDFDTDYGYIGKGSKTVLSLATKNNIDGAYNGTVSVTSTGTNYEGYWANNIQVQGGQKYSASVLVHYNNGGHPNGIAMLDIWFIDSKGARIGSASRSTSQVSSPYWVQLVSEGFTAPTNAVYLQMSLIVNNAGPGQVAMFTQPMLTATEKLQKYTPNDDISSQLSLFKDNWSIGINDNISKITSGIVGNASQMSLISNNVTIDSPNTQIKGTAWIQSAMIANGAIGSAQIGDATITSAKIATLDVAKLTGNVSSFIQSNWNGSYGSTQITDTGMTVTSKSPRADLSIRSVFDANGLTMYTPKGTTVIRDGETAYISSSNEDIGMMGTVKWGPHPNVDYLMIGLHGYHTTTPGDSSYDKNSDGSNVVYGGDGIGFGISDSHGGYDMLMTWDSPLVAGYQNRMSGWHVEDVFSTELMFYANSGLEVSSYYSGSKHTLHTQGMDTQFRSKWFGFMSGDNKAGFGTDNTQDVIFFMKGKSYSLYAMLDKLHMR